MNGTRSLTMRRIALNSVLIVFAVVRCQLLTLGEVHGAESRVSVRQIEPPVDWDSPAKSSLWHKVPAVEWLRFQQSVQTGEGDSAPPAPVVMDAVYRATFDGARLEGGTFEWTLHRFDESPGFVELGRSSLTVSQLQWASRPAIHGMNPQGDWVLWSESGADRLTGRWSHRGKAQLEAVTFDITLPQALSSRLEIRVPSGWDVNLPGAIGPETGTDASTDHSVWKFDLGRQQKIHLKLEKTRNAPQTQILLRENTVYGLTATDDLIRSRTDWDCTINGPRNADLLLSVPRTLRVFNVLLGNELPLTFERELGSIEDQIRIPLNSLSPGQRIALRILGESTRPSDRAFALPRLRPVNAILQEGTIRLAVDRPLEVRVAQTTALRQSKLTEEGGQEIRSYEVLSNDSELELQVGEPVATLQGEILFMADVRGEAPVSRARVRLSTREGELYSPQMLIPDDWDLISVTTADSSDLGPAAWQVSEGPPGENLLNLVLRQPIRPDRDCTLLLEFKSVALKPAASRRPPIPRLRDAQNCYVRGVVWDHWPWELDNGSTGSVELDGAAADDELRQAVNWGVHEDPQAISTGIRIPSFDTRTTPLFRTEGSTPLDSESVAGGLKAANDQSLLCANLELETRTSRVGRSHPHRAAIQFTRAASPDEFRLKLPLVAELTRVVADHREISFVRHEDQVVLDPSAKPFTELALEYRTSASPGWIVSRDEVVFPQLDCFVTEFAWHLILDPERMLYRLPLTAAVTPREQSRPWERLLGPLARHTGESLFNPLSRADWKSLLNGTTRGQKTSSPNDVWFVVARVPERITLKTWNLDVSHGLAWCSFLGALAAGIALRRARQFWFRRSWIYLGGTWLVLAVFVAEPYAPIAGGAFLGSLLAIIVPRRFAISLDWLNERRVKLADSTGRAATVTSLLLATVFAMGIPSGQGQDAGLSPELTYFEITEGEQPYIVFDASFRSRWDAFQEQLNGPAWLLKSSRYDVQSEGAGPPRVTATYEVIVFGDQPRAALRLPLDGVSLDQVEGLIDGQPVRLIPATEGQGFVLPLVIEERPDRPQTPPPPPATESRNSIPIVTRTITLKFRPLPETSDDELLSFSATIPPLPECVVVLNSERWRLSSDLGDTAAPAEKIGLCELGPVGQFTLTSGSPSLSPPENLSDVQLRTLVECGPLGARVQLGVLALVQDSRIPSELTIVLPPNLSVQTITGLALDQSIVRYQDTETLVTLRLQPTREGVSLPVEIKAFLPASPEGFQIAPPRWKPNRVQQVETLAGVATAQSRSERSLIGVVAKPGFRVFDASPPTSAAPLSPQEFSDSLFSGMVWQIPNLAWTCRNDSGPIWKLETISHSSRAQLAQIMTLSLPKSEWQLEATIDTTQGIPFEHLFTIDPRIEINRAVVQQDGADRLLRWTRIGDQVHLSVRDGQPGTQSIRMEGVIAQGAKAWEPPLCEYRSGQTTESSVAIRGSSRVVATLKWASSKPQQRKLEGASEEFVRFSPGGPTAPSSIQVEPVAEERQARAWINLVPQRDRSWQMTLRAQIQESAPFVSPVRIVWDQPGLSEIHLTNRRDNLRQTANGKAFLWRPQPQLSKPAELTLSAVIDGEAVSGHSIQLPTLSGVVWSEIWVSFPRGAGYRLARAHSTLQSTTPAGWPATWTENLAGLREDLYLSDSPDISIEASSSEPVVRPVLAESLVWLDGEHDPAALSRIGVTKYLLIAERDVTLDIPTAARSMIRSISVDGRMQSSETPVRVTSRASDLSHELIVWWQTPAGTLGHDPGDLIRLPGSLVFPHWVGVIPPHHRVLLNHWGRSDPLRTEFWLNRSESMLRAAEEFQGAPWTVDGPLLHQLADSRDELSRATNLTPDESKRRDQLMQKWKAFSQSSGSISSPIVEQTLETHYSGLDAVLSLCGESRSFWLRSSQASDHWPQLLDRRWALMITAGLASLASLLILTWVVRLFRRFDLAEVLAARPNETMTGLGLVWWAFLSPSVLGLALAILGAVQWGRERLSLARAERLAAGDHPT